MPKTTLFNAEKDNRVFRSVVAKNMELYAIDENKIATICQFTVRTFQNKMKRPETFTLKELRKLAHLLCFTDEDKVSIL